MAVLEPLCAGPFDSSSILEQAVTGIECAEIGNRHACLR